MKRQDRITSLAGIHIYSPLVQLNVRGRTMRGIYILIVIIALGGTAIGGETAVSKQHHNGPATADLHQLTIEANFIGGSLGYSYRMSDKWFAGFRVGVGGDLLDLMLFSGRHFAEEAGWAYEERDRYTEKQVIELIHLNLTFTRDLPGKFSMESAARASAFWHLDSSDDDPGGGYFLGGIIQPMFGTRYVKIGTKIMTGFFMETNTREFGIHLGGPNLRLQLYW